MVKVSIEYLNDLHCKLTHGPSGQQFITDAPVDNKGKGEYFSPTDLVASAVGSCVATIMGILADTRNIDIKGLRIDVTKEMAAAPPRRIVRLGLEVFFPIAMKEHDLAAMKNVVNTCPVIRSLDPNIELDVIYHTK